MQHRWGAGAAALAILAASPLAEQIAQAQAKVAFSAPAVSAAEMDAEVVREFDDPATGLRWLLERDPARPGGPGLLVAVSGRSSGKATEGQPRQRRPAVLSSVRPVIRASDQLVVIENTPVVEARLEAVAMGPAVAGQKFEARLKIGGKVVDAVALGPGRALLVAEAKGWR
jgi:hypothetical protein